MNGHSHVYYSHTMQLNCDLFGKTLIGKRDIFFQLSLAREECVGDKRARYDRCLCINAIVEIEICLS